MIYTPEEKYSNMLDSIALMVIVVTFPFADSNPHKQARS